MADDVAIESITDPDQIRMKLLASGRGVHAPLSALDDFYQPKDADLTSWAAVARALGFDAFAAAPSSANFAALLTDESGTGVVPFLDANTYTPTFTASAGTFTSVTAISGSYRKFGPVIWFTAQGTLTTIGTASGNVLISLPSFTPGTGTWIGDGRSAVVGGTMLQVIINSGATTAIVTRYDAASVISAGAQIIITASYWV